MALTKKTASESPSQPLITDDDDSVVIHEKTFEAYLKYPREIEGTLYDRLFFRRPEGRHLRQLLNSKASALMDVAASLSEDDMNARNLEVLDAEDLSRIFGIITKLTKWKELSDD